MPTLDDVYRKFGETAEAAQLLETELGTALMVVDALEENLLTAANPGRAAPGDRLRWPGAVASVAADGAVAR